MTKSSYRDGGPLGRWISATLGGSASRSRFGVLASHEARAADASELPFDDLPHVLPRDAKAVGTGVAAVVAHAIGQIDGERAA